jgi:hypothetical protein
MCWKNKLLVGGTDVSTDCFVLITLSNKSWISADRRTKPTLTLTILWCVHVVCKECKTPLVDWSLYSQDWNQRSLVQNRSIYAFWLTKGSCITLLSRLGSDLEAFSHYPASLALQHWFSNQLHYQMLEPSVPLVLSWITVAMLIISRVKLTCLTTV